MCSTSWRSSARSTSKLAFGTMNRGGIMGARWELDDRMTAYDAEGIASGGLDGGKVLLRIADDDAGTAPTLEACARAVSALARRALPIMVEPLPYHLDADGAARLLDDDDKLLRAVAVAAGLGTSSAYTWLKVPAGPGARRALSVTTLPALLLGGAPGPEPEATFAAWEEAMTIPNVRGLVVGRALLYPPDGDVAGAIGRAARIVRPEASGWLTCTGAPERWPPGRTPWRSVLKRRAGRTRACGFSTWPRVNSGPSTPARTRWRSCPSRRRVWRWTPVGSTSISTAGPASSLESATSPTSAGSTVLTLTASAPGEVALATARCTEEREPRYGPAEDVAVEVRGAGPATRQVTNFLSPDAWPHAERLMCVELLTPDGNWSSYPPHKHDDSPECPVNNEEIYYFRIAPAAGFGLHRLYTSDGQIDETVEVRDGDVFLIPRGYHGPCVAAPGYTMYYLNVLAGSGPGRSMAFCDDPAHHWVRDSWEGMATDPRCPMTSAGGVVGG